MTRDDIIRMAREAGFLGLDADGRLQRFAALVAAEIKLQMVADGWRQCARGQKTTQFCGQLEAAVAAEREECAKEVRGFFAVMRFDRRHLGLGDVRVTIGDVDDLAGSICKNQFEIEGVKDSLITEEAVAAEREECAKLCDEISNQQWVRLPKEEKKPAIAASDCAAAIRGRK